MALACACESGGAAEGAPHGSANDTLTGPARPPGPGDVAGAVSAIMRRMGLRERVGQLFVSAVPGLTADQGGADLVRTYHLGGVIYFSPNLRGAAQVARLSNGLQDAAMGGAPRVPLTVGTDQEGGVVARLGRIVTAFPSQMAAGATRDPALVEAQERVTGRQLRALGINLDYAPVADVNSDPANPVIGTRSFGSQPALVAGMTQAAIAGFHAAGVAAAAKHFPGHGDTHVDSHTGLPVIRQSLRQWQRIDAPPFEAAIRGGADVIMSAHIVVPALSTSGDPATLSPEVIDGVLRGKLGYRGVIITDSLQMAGVRERYDDARIAIRAIQAGCDELLMPQNLPTAFNAVLGAVRDGTISVARLDQSVRRILTLKADRGLLANPRVDVGAAAGQMNSVSDVALARTIADRSVTLVKNKGVLPLKRGVRIYVAGTDAVPLAAALARFGAVAVTSARLADAVVLSTTNAMNDPAQQALGRRLLAARTPVIVVATGRPYDVGLFPEAAAAAATYSDTAESIMAAAGVLTGAINPSGRLPVTIPAAGAATTYPFGARLRY